jgi:hypothetical protein
MVSFLFLAAENIIKIKQTAKELSRIKWGNRLN